jgi:hypothetical protein
MHYAIKAADPPTLTRVVKIHYYVYLRNSERSLAKERVKALDRTHALVAMRNISSAPAYHDDIYQTPFHMATSALTQNTGKYQ